MEDWQPEPALRELLRARLSGFGPLPAAVIAADLQLPLTQVQAGLLALQADGFVIAGRFTPGAAQDEWCERHLLARIHRYTLGRLRREIEPVPARDYARFLFRWQHLDAESRVAGPEALAGVLAQLEGYEAQAAVWERNCSRRGCATTRPRGWTNCAAPAAPCGRVCVRRPGPRPR